MPYEPSEKRGPYPRDYSDSERLTLGAVSSGGPRLELPPIQKLKLPKNDLASDWRAIGDAGWNILARRRFGDIFPHDSRVSEFDRYVDQMRCAGAPYSKHVFIGLNPTTNGPVFLHRDVLKRHAYILGATGSGKSTAALASLLIQLAEGSDDPMAPTIIFDMGDNPSPVLHHIAMSIARKRGQPLRRFSTDADLESLYFDPFYAFRDILDPQEVAETIQKSIGLVYLDGYGSAFFTSEQRNLLEEQFCKRPRSFSELVQLVRNATQGRGGNKHAQGVYSALAPLTRFVHAHTDGTPLDAERRLDLERLIENGEVLYVHLNSKRETLTRDVGRLILYSLVHVASRRVRRGHKLRQVYVYLDEFQKLAAHNIVQMFEDVRNSGIGLILAHQSRSSMVSNDPMNLFNVLWDNVGFKQLLSLTDEIVKAKLEMLTPRRRELLETVTESEQRTWGSTRSRSTSYQPDPLFPNSGYEHVMFGDVGSDSAGGSEGTSRALREEYTPGFDEEDVCWVHERELRSVYHVRGEPADSISRTRGIPTHLQGIFALTHEENDRISRFSWPRVSEEEQLRKLKTATSQTIALPSSAPVTKQRSQDAYPGLFASRGNDAELTRRVLHLWEDLEPHAVEQVLRVSQFARRANRTPAEVLDLGQKAGFKLRMPTDFLMPAQVDALQAAMRMD